jgi:hypothetical protein
VPPPPQQQVWETATPPPRQITGPFGGRTPSPKLIVGAVIVVALLLLGVVVAAVVVKPGGIQRSISSFSSFGAPQTAKEVLQGLKDEGMPIGKSEAYNAENDPNKLLGRPNQYTSKVNFKDTRLKPDPIAGKFDVPNGGSIEVFEDQDDAIARKKYLEGLGKSFSPMAEYSYREGTVLLRVSNRLTPKQAAEYQEALKSIL